MGFSVSGSAALIFVGLLISVGMAYTATANGFELVSEAQEDRTDRTLDRQNTAISVADATWHDGTDELTVNATNAGATQLSVGAVDLLANNTYLTGYATTVDGDGATDLWLPQEELTITVTSLSTDPERVKLVTGPGVAETEGTVVV